MSPEVWGHSTDFSEFRRLEKLASSWKAMESPREHGGQTLEER